MQQANKPIRCFDGNAQPHEPFWKITNTAGGKDPEIELYGTISEYSWYDDEVTPGKFREDLYKAGNGGPITVRINSYGGDVIAASLMHAIIRDYPGKVTVQIDGIAASAATVVAMAGDHVKMRNTGYFMIHDPLVVFFLAALNIEDLNRLANSLKAVKDGIINAYTEKTGMPRDRLSNLMTEQTWMDANMAKDLGFIDEVIEKSTKLYLPDNTGIVNSLQFANIPDELLKAMNRFGSQAQPAQKQCPENKEANSEVENLRNRVDRILRKESPENKETNSEVENLRNEVDRILRKEK